MAESGCFLRHVRRSEEKEKEKKERSRPHYNVNWPGRRERKEGKRQHRPIFFLSHLSAGPGEVLASPRWNLNLVLRGSRPQGGKEGKGKKGGEDLRGSKISHSRDSGHYEPRRRWKEERKRKGGAATRNRFSRLLCVPSTRRCSCTGLRYATQGGRGKKKREKGGKQFHHQPTISGSSLTSLFPLPTPAWGRGEKKKRKKKRGGKGKKERDTGGSGDWYTGQTLRPGWE